MVVVLGLANILTAARLVGEMLELGNVMGMVVPPSLLGDSRQDFLDMLEQVRNFRYVHYLVAPLQRRIGDLICQHVRLASLLGRTEAGPYFAKFHDDSGWSYNRSSPPFSFTSEPRNNSFYGVGRVWSVGIRASLCSLKQLDLPTKGLMTRRPNKPDLWAFAGRSADVISMSNGISFKVLGVEAVRHEPFERANRTHWR